MIQPDWIMGLLGGLMIGCAASMYLLINGNIMGASGIVGGLFETVDRTKWIERASFVVGLVVLPGIVAVMTGKTETNLTTNLVVVAFAGLLVGLGARMANGCTSGHGICGISRLSIRGIMATVFYLFAGGVSVLVFRHIWGII